MDPYIPQRNARHRQAGINSQLETSASGSDKLGLPDRCNWTVGTHNGGGEAKQLFPDKQFTNKLSACTVLYYDAAHRNREIVGRVRSLGIAPPHDGGLTC